MELQKNYEKRCAVFWLFWGGGGLVSGVLALFWEGDLGFLFVFASSRGGSSTVTTAGLINFPLQLREVCSTICKPGV